MVAKLFPTIDIGQMNFYSRNRDCCERIPDRYAIMRERCRINNDTAEAAFRRLNRIHHHTLVIGLQKFNPYPQLDGFI